jgi:hypothetical protein
MAGTRKRNIHGAMVNKLPSEAYPESSTFKSPGNTHINKLLATKKTIITIYPVSEEKNPRISLNSKTLIRAIFKFDTQN